MNRLDRVRATESVGQVNAGDEGEVVARWTQKMVTVRWDKDNQLRRIHRDRLQLAGSSDEAGNGFRDGVRDGD